MYKKLTDKQVRFLTNKCSDEHLLVVSHVGDGEYSCNVFGNIYSSPWQALKAARKAHEHLPQQVLSMYECRDDAGEIINLLISGRTDEEFTEHIYWNAYARLTFEKINQPFVTGM
jgi:hypothetical protein